MRWDEQCINCESQIALLLLRTFPHFPSQSTFNNPATNAALSQNQPETAPKSGSATADWRTWPAWSASNSMEEQVILRIFRGRSELLINKPHLGIRIRYLDYYGRSFQRQTNILRRYGTWGPLIILKHRLLQGLFKFRCRMTRWD